MARKNLADSFLSSFGTGYSLSRKVREDARVDEVRNGIAQADVNFTPSQETTASGEDALAAGQQARDQALSMATDDTQRAQVEQDYQPTMDALDSRRGSPAGVIQSMGIGGSFQQRDRPFSAQEVDDAKARAKADIYSASGFEGDASRVLLNASRRREMTDQDELRASMAGGSQDQSLAAGATDQGARQSRDQLDFYLKEQVPKAIQTLVSQGHIEEAKRYSDFLESQNGLAYAKTYTNGLRRFAIGDHAGALSQFEKLYNDNDMYADGRKVKLTPLDGDQMRIDHLDADGKLIGTKTGKIRALAESAALSLNPLQAVKFLAEQQGKRQAEGATLDRQIQLEQLRQDGQEGRDDRRDQRLQMRLDQQERRLSSGGGLTNVQQRTNAEIDAAREAVGGMSTQEIMRRTAKATNTGRENPDYDPALSRQASLANRRKIGSDEDFDSRQGRQAQPQAAPFQRATAALAADPAMAGYALGEQTTKGFKVYDKSGRHVGYFGSRK